MIAFLVLTATTFCLFGFILGLWADGFDQLQFIPMLVITPLTFLGGAFYSIDMLPAGVAHVQPLQPGRLPDQRLPLDLLRHLGRRRRGQPGDDAGALRRLPDRGDVDLQDRVSAQELKAKLERQTGLRKL